MAIAHRAQAAPTADDIQIREIGLHDLRLALGRGWQGFMSKRGDLVFVGFIYPVVALLAALMATNVSVLPLVVPVAAGAILMGPAAASGFYELARREQLGLESGWRHFFDAWRTTTADAVATLTAMVAVLFLAWIMCAWTIYLATMGAMPIESPAAFVHAVFATRAGWNMMVLGNLVGLGFAIVALGMTVVSFPMLVDRRVGVATALRTSLRVTMKNPVTIAVWGVIVVALLALGALPAFVGLGVVLPVLGYATWHLYTLAVVRPEQGQP